MKGDSIPDEDNTLRYCGFDRLTEDGVASLTAFLPKNRTEDYLSVFWLEFYSGKTRKEQVQKVRNTCGLALGVKAKFAEIRGGMARDYVYGETGNSVRLRFLHWPEEDDNNDSHSGIFDAPKDPDNSLLVAQLLADCVHDTWPARGN